MIKKLSKFLVIWVGLLCATIQLSGEAWSQNLELVRLLGTIYSDRGDAPNIMAPVYVRGGNYDAFAPIRYNLIFAGVYLKVMGQTPMVLEGMHLRGELESFHFVGKDTEYDKGEALTEAEFRQDFDKLLLGVGYRWRFLFASVDQAYRYHGYSENNLTDSDYDLPESHWESFQQIRLGAATVPSFMLGQAGLRPVTGLFSEFTYTNHFRNHWQEWEEADAELAEDTANFQKYQLNVDGALYLWNRVQSRFNLWHAQGENLDRLSAFQLGGLSLSEPNKNALPGYYGGEFRTDRSTLLNLMLGFRGTLFGKLQVLWLDGAYANIKVLSVTEDIHYHDSIRRSVGLTHQTSWNRQINTEFKAGYAIDAQRKNDEGDWQILGSITYLFTSPAEKP